MKSALLKNVDCIELYVSDLDEGMKYYCDGMGLKLLWRTEKMVGLGMEEGITEFVLQTERKRRDVDFCVDSVSEAIEQILKAGGMVKDGPFDIPIGKCAVIKDRWENEYIILDMSKGTYVTDDNNNVINIK
ncbi:VOC family protein [Anaerocolumna sp. AGMB13020]|uniref:VOC family protein n=1 Tax=Anaerocolumna sp. AGMB13020 TaxID=3081750 RepID=UPI0029544E35|nr:VOC family protein [Anaerocolumna sp. AGMB13020]WOO38960.1 VOC family protein [Anaerocolumna sp. AGMB13020]